MTKARPKTGESRAKQQPLKIDRLPIDVRDAIQYLKNERGKTWQEIEELSAAPYNPKWISEGGGFVHWEELPTQILELFPDLRLPHSNLHRWYDLRVSQVVAETMARSAQAREIAAAFAKSIVAGEDDAVLNAARDQIMSVLAEDATPKGRMKAAGALISLAEMLQERRANNIKERKVAIDERRLVQMEKDAELKRRKFSKEMDAAEKKISRGQALTKDDIDRIRERVFGIGPTQNTAH
jgi:hypothetical protein